MDITVAQANSARSGKRGRDFEIASLAIPPALSLLEDSRSIASWRCGRIVVQKGQLQMIQGRHWPYLGNHLQALWDRRFRPLAQDRCELYYHQAWSTPNFLTLSYVRAGARTSLTTLYTAAFALDEIARLKNSSAIVAHVSNRRISNRLLQRWGWQPHCFSRPGRHFIKRFYGNYPEIAADWHQRLQATGPEN